MQKKIISLFVILIFMLGICRNIYAFDLLASIDNEQLEEKKVNVSLTVSDLDTNPEGINAISGKIVYDSDIFDKVSITGVNNWSVAYNDEKGNENEGKFILLTTSGNVNKDTKIANIELVLKQDIKNCKTQITIQNIQTSYQSEKISAEDKTINLEINNDNIKLIENGLDQNSTNSFNYIYIILAIIVIFIVLIMLIIKYKGMKTNEK